MIETTRFGKVEVDSEKVVTFHQGLIGFPTLNEFIILDHSPGSKFHWLQSLQRGDLAFPVVDPDEFVDGYMVTPPKGLSENIGEFEAEDLILSTIVTFPQGSGRATLNLKAPIIMNSKTRRGVQIVLEDPKVPIRFPIGKK